MDAAVQLLRKAYEMGINYFDTAMVYHKGESEKIFGKAFEPYPRDSYLIADKMSIWLCSDEEDMKARFYNQLKTLKTDYIDFYLVSYTHLLVIQVGGFGGGQLGRLGRFFRLVSRWGSLLLLRLCSRLRNAGDHLLLLGGSILLL